MSVAELFERHGEASFRLGEAKVIERLLSGEPIVLATGGGALIDAGTRALVASRAISVWIRADVDTLVRRATRRPVRPLLKVGDPKETIARLLDARAQYYEAADIVVDTKPTSHAQTVTAIVGALRDHLSKETDR
jgi:shikimate kinase